MKPPQHRAAFAAVVLAVLAAHALLADRVAGELAALHEGPPPPPRLEVAFVRTLALAAQPPRPASPRPVARLRRHPKPAAPAASRASQGEAAAPPASAPEPGPAQQLVAAEAPASSPAPAASAPEAAASAVAEDFAWPASTRITYLLEGYWRGEMKGSAQVEWLRVDRRYQVNIDIVIGLRSAPLMSRRMSSNGDITPQGLAPRRFDQETKVALASPRRVVMLFEDAEVQLANGLRVPRPAGLQDTASQLVQLTYEFTVRPQSLRAGESVALPIALPRYVANFVYEIVGEETLYTRFGEVPAFHVKPRREAVQPGDLALEAWFAPHLQYLPVRIHITQDAQTWLDLTIDQLPEQAAR